MNNKKSQALDLIDILLLKPDKKGLYKTSWGNKTKEGLIKTIINIMADEQY